MHQNKLSLFTQLFQLTEESVMNSIHVWGTPNGIEEGVYKTLTATLIRIFESREFDPVVVFFPPDRMQWGLGEEIKIYISGPQIPDTRKQELAELVGQEVYSVFHPKYIDCVVSRDEPLSGERRWFIP